MKHGATWALVRDAGSVRLLAIGRLRAARNDPVARRVLKSIDSDLPRLDEREVRNRIEALIRKR